ncbi:MAG: hypothetical protein HY975_02670 [Candidatus Kerfeldbacteria bacterium]|nr:hypothetical protein [Candidatus Kerfeldbacteria bacterium]
MKRWLAVSLTTFAGLFVATSVGAASLNLTPGSGSHPVGQSWTVTVTVNAAGQAINASEGTIVWTTPTLSLKSISTSGSIFQFWAIQPSGSDATGRVIFSGGLPSPGYNGSGGTILRLTFQAKAVGTATVQLSGGKVLANDGQGTDVLTTQGKATYTITPATTTTPTTPSVPSRPTPLVTVTGFPNQAQWYAVDRGGVTYSRPAGLQGVSYIVDQQLSTTPPENVNHTTGTFDVTVPSDGLWYLHLRGKYESGWSSTVHYALRRDIAPPEPFALSLNQPRGTDDPAPQVLFTTTDAASGIAKYAATLDGGAAQDVSSPYTLNIRQAGAHEIVITAVDQAGNTREASLSFETTGYPAPIITSASSPLLLLDPLVVRGTASAGDTVTVYVNGQAIGQVIAGPADPSAAASGVTVTIPWVLTSDRLFRPGTYQVTASATSPDGRVSVLTNPVSIQVVGHALLVGGRPLLTISVVTPLLIFAISIFVAIVGVLFRTWWALWSMHRRVRYAEEELEALRSVSGHQGISREQLNHALQQIETDLDRTPPRSTTKRRPTKRTARS